MSNNFRKTTVLKKLRILLKKLRALHALEDLEPLFKIFYTFVCKKVQGIKNYRQIKQASG